MRVQNRMNPSRASLVVTCMAVLGFLPAVAEEPELGVRVTPAAVLPLGADAEFFGTGVQAQLDGAFSPGFLPLLVGSVGAGYAFNPLAIDTSLSVISGGGAVGLRVPVGESAWLEAGGGGGYYFGLLNDNRAPGSGGGYVRGGAGLFIGVSPGFVLGLSGEYRNYLGLGQFLSIGLTGAVRSRRATVQPLIQQPIITAPRPLSEAAEAEILQIRDTSIAEVFPVFFKSYDTQAVGSAALRNVSDTELTEIQMSLFIADYMDNPTACHVPSTLEPGEAATVDLFTFFNERVLTIEQAVPKSAELSVRFMRGEEEHQRIYTQNILLHDRNSMTWDDDRKIAAYVTPRDAAVLALSRQVSAVARDAAQSAVHPSLRTAIALHTALSLYGTTYTPDPSSPYRLAGRDYEIDYLQFPRQTLAYRAGDCDDLSALYCAVFESLSIPSAFIFVPGHIYVAFNLEMSPAQGRAQFARAEDLIFQDDETWIPLEITSISDGFLVAWQTGAREWREAVARDEDLFIPTMDAWDSFLPVGLPATEASLDLPSREAILEAYTGQVTHFVDQTIYPLVARLQGQIAERGRAPSIVNRLAVLYARYGLYDRARTELEVLVAERPDYSPAIANLGNIMFQQGDFAGAEQAFQQALFHDPDNPAILLCLARASHELENYGTATRSFDRVKELDPELATRYAYLDLRGDDAARAAEIGGLSADAYWIDEEEDE